MFFVSARTVNAFGILLSTLDLFSVSFVSNMLTNVVAAITVSENSWLLGLLGSKFLTHPSIPPNNLLITSSFIEIPLKDKPPNPSTQP